MLSRVLDHEQIERIHQASLEILQRTGVVVPHKGVLSYVADVGAQVDMEKQLVHIPSDLVIRSLEQIGKKFTIYGRDILKSTEKLDGRLDGKDGRFSL